MSMRKGRIYIAGPMRGVKDFNSPAFDAATKMLQKQGWEIFSPAAATREAWGKDILQSPTGDEAVLLSAGHTRRAVFLQDTNWICSRADAMYMLRNWEGSVGARAEWALAQAIELPLYYAPEQPEALDIQVVEEVRGRRSLGNFSDLPL